MSRTQSNRSPVFVIAPEATLAEDSDGGVTLFDARSGRYWRGNSGSRRILRMLRDPVTATEIIDVLEYKYEVEHHRITKDVKDFIDHLVSARLVRKVKK